MSSQSTTPGSTSLQDTGRIVGNRTGNDVDADLTRDEVFDILNNRRRRLTIEYLREQGSTTDLGNLCDYVASRENEIPPEQLGSDQRKRVYTALKQSHIPKMERADVVEFDDRDNDIRLTEQASELDVYLEVVPDDDIPWSRYYLGLGGIFAAVLGFRSMGIWPTGVIPDLALMALMVGILLASAIGHSWRTEGMKLGSETATTRE